jgi:hypothetical protein
LAELRRAPPNTLEDLKITVEAFADSMDKEEITKAVRHLRTSAQVCKQLNGAAFETHLKKLKRHLANEE